MNTLDMNNIATTAAFMVAAWPRGDELSAMLEGWGEGHLELMQEVSQYAVISEQWLTKGKPQDFPGVYDYEVSEPFGEWFVDYVLTHVDNRAPPLAEGKAKLRELFDEFFAQK